MIIWLASYPKSGNTFVRSFLSAYYYSHDGIFDFGLLSNIQQFPEKEFFTKQINNAREAAEEWILAQKKIIENKKIRFLKTHSCLGTFENKDFTTPETTLGAIYIVRDPRSIFTSLKNHFSMNDDEAMDMLLDEKRSLISNPGAWSSYSFISSWSNNYISWLRAKQFRRLVIKYEDLLTNKYETFRDIIVFINTLMNLTEGVNKIKLEKSIDTTNFYTLKKKEIREGLDKSVTNFKKWRNSHQENKNLFFNLGPENNWKKLLKKDVAKKIELKFENEMKNLKYL